MFPQNKVVSLPASVSLVIHCFLLNTVKIKNVLYMINIKGIINSIAECFATKSEIKIHFCWQVIYE